ncbi:uncharacterized protein LOC117651871, partial [Thrips palmi]|uniref:Uncharacterized protein LOC117651871 n=1 Tax=Thrips palmi TaxID=161013 RepID=A0A6P9A486_THRPL
MSRAEGGPHTCTFSSTVLTTLRNELGSKMADAQNPVDAGDVQTASATASPSAVSGGDKHPGSEGPEGTYQDAAILRLSVEVLLRVCRCLEGQNLFQLGRVCRALRAVARDRHAWSHVEATFVRWSQPRPVWTLAAPALRAVRVDCSSGGANPLRCTRLVRELHIDCERSDHHCGGCDFVPALLEHYGDNLKVLGCPILKDMSVLLQCSALTSLHLTAAVATAGTLWEEEHREYVLGAADYLRTAVARLEHLSVEFP